MFASSVIEGSINGPNNNNNTTPHHTTPHNTTPHHTIAYRAPHHMRDARPNPFGRGTGPNAFLALLHVLIYRLG